tara:strand:+ start:126 stop:611 length:486 start_codon:yes stop_codon:yes gene_type:complete
LIKLLSKMKKFIRIFGEKDCQRCIPLRNVLENADIIKLNKNVEYELIFPEEGDPKIEWEKVMERTGVFFLPHIEITWDGGEVHLSDSRDFVAPSEALEKLTEILSDDYSLEDNLYDKIELTEKIKSLTYMQEILYEKMQSSVKNFTNIRDFINIPGSKIEL